MPKGVTHWVRRAREEMEKVVSLLLTRLQHEYERLPLRDWRVAVPREASTSAGSRAGTSATHRTGQSVFLHVSHTAQAMKSTGCRYQAL